MNRPRGPGSPPDPDVAARLKRILDPRAAPDATPVRRAEGPPPERLEVAYALDLDAHDKRPVVEVRLRWVTAGKPRGRWEVPRLTEKSVGRFPDEDDREIVGALVALRTSGALLLSADDEVPRSRFTLSRNSCARLLPLLGRTGRFALSRRPEDVPLTWQEMPWALRLRVTVVPPDAKAPAGPGGETWEIHGVLRSGAREVTLAEVDAFLEGGFAIAGGQLGRVDDGGASSWLGMLLTHRKVRITPPRRAAFLEELFSLTAHPPLDLPRGVALPEITAEATPRLLVHAPGVAPDGTPAASASAQGPLFAELSFVYDEAVVTARRPGKVAFDPARMRLLRRDAEAEAAALARLEALGVQAVTKAASVALPEAAHLSLPAARLPAIVAALVAEGWRVEADGRAYRKPQAWQMAVSSGVDWLDLSGTVDFGGVAAPLPAVLAALRRGVNAVVLDDGSLGLLPDEWLARHGIVLRLGVAHEGRLRFSRSQAPLLETLAAGDPSSAGALPVSVRFDEVFEARRREALAAEGALGDGTAEAPPERFTGELRAYQRAGLGWLRFLERVGLGGLLADDMGLGKTVQVLAHLAARRGRPSLVVAPRSLIFNWKREVARFAPHLRLLDYTGADRKPPGAHFAEHDLVLTTYGTLRRDADALAAIHFDYVILDEAQAIKNDTSDTARAARRLSATHRLALSGTPVENHLGELWSIVEFLNPGQLGRAAAWKAATAASPSPEAVGILSRALRPILLRRTKAEVAPDLPARLEETLVVELDAPERALYEELRARFRAEVLGKARVKGSVGNTHARVLEALLRLRQAACHPGLLDPARRGQRCAKLDALLPELVALRDNGQKALVFSQFRTLLDLVRPPIEAEGIRCAQLDGTTQDREATVAHFQSDPSVSVLLVSLKAGGVGLNLTAAEYVFLLDPWWNPAAEAQAIDRAHRIGQTKAVFAYRLIARDTVEERIVELQQKKRGLAESVIRGDGAPLRDLSLEDLDQLLS